MFTYDWTYKYESIIITDKAVLKKKTGNYCKVNIVYNTRETVNKLD